MNKATINLITKSSTQILFITLVVVGVIVDAAE
jgi:hypothetical protein